MSEKNDRKQRKYWNDHLRDMYLDEDGEYSYRGAFYEIQGDGKVINLRAWLLVAIIDVALIASGLFPATGAMDTWYVILPYAATIICAGFVTYYMARWTIRGVQRLREYIYKKTILRLNGATRALSILGIITAILEGFHLIMNGMGEHPKGAIILIICAVLTGVLGNILFRSIKAQEWLNLAE